MLVNRRASCLIPSVILLLVNCAAPVSPQMLDASREKTVRSLASETKAQITFENKSGQKIKIYWLDFFGHRILYKVLDVGEHYDQETFLTHPWLITDASDNAWNIFLAGSRPSVVDVVAPIPK